MVDGDDDSSCGGAANVVPPPQPPRKTYWRSASWSASRTQPDCSSAAGNRPDKLRTCPPVPPLTPRSKARHCLPPLQPLSITRRSLDEWPLAGSDDVGEWPAHPPTPGAAGKDSLKIDHTSLRSVGRRDQLALFDKECSKVADHIYFGGDAVARNREILRQNGITHVLNCVGFVCPEYFKSDLVYKTLWLQDSPTEDITSILYDVFDYFEDVREQGGRVFVHCCQGVSRSTSLVIAYLMWREGQSFEDAFQFVRAARSIANPNMGFACQLLQCQKRVLAIPLSPNSVLRMYRMAPHSPYDALHLVPKVLNNPSPNMLDSRGAFILHVSSSIYVWIGKSCEPAMEKDAKAAAFQVVRYERVQGPILTVEEGEEPPDFWEAFANTPIGSEKTRKEDADFAAKICAGKRGVDAYDADFELFYKAISGGVVPPFSSSGGPGQETHIPARESNWSVLRRKFISGALSRIYSDSVISRNGDPRPNRIRFLSADASASPPFLSPNSLSSNSSSCSKSNSESPSLSPSSMCSPLTPSAVSSNLIDCLQPSSKPSLCLSGCLGSLKSCSEKENSPSKGFSRSIAERRGSFSLLKLPTLTKDSTLRTKIELSHDHEIPAEDLDRSDCEIVNTDVLGRVSGEVFVRGSSRVIESVVHSSRNCAEPQTNVAVKDSQVSSDSAEFSDRSTKTLHLKEMMVYQWPDNEILRKFSREDLNSRKVFFILTSNTDRGEVGRTLYIWVGSNFEHANLKNQPCHDGDAGQAFTIDWSLIGHDFLASKGLPVDIPVKVIMKQESVEFDELLKSM